MIHQFVATFTGSDLTTREIAYSTVETDRGSAAALRLAVVDLEERGALRGQPGLDVREIPGVPVEIEISKKHEQHPGRDGSYWTKTITVDLPARTATIKETFWDNSTRETSEPTVTTRPATDDEIRQAEDRADCA